jgi:hypothetical protein
VLARLADVAGCGWLDGIGQRRRLRTSPGCRAAGRFFTRRFQRRPKTSTRERGPPAR